MTQGVVAIVAGALGIVHIGVILHVTAQDQARVSRREADVKDQETGSRWGWAERSSSTKTLRANQLWASSLPSRVALLFMLLLGHVNPWPGMPAAGMVTHERPWLQ